MESTPVGMPSGHTPPLRLDVSPLPGDSRIDIAILEKIVSVYQTYACSMTKEEQQEYIAVVENGEYLNERGTSGGVTHHRLYLGMRNRSKVFIEDKITFPNWAILVALFTPIKSVKTGLRYLATAAKMQKDRGRADMDRTPCFAEYARHHDTSLSEVIIPEVKTLLPDAQNEVFVQITDGGRQNVASNGDGVTHRSNHGGSTQQAPATTAPCGHSGVPTSPIEETPAETFYLGHQESRPIPHSSHRVNTDASMADNRVGVQSSSSAFTASRGHEENPPTSSNKRSWDHTQPTDSRKRQDRRVEGRVPDPYSYYGTGPVHGTVPGNGTVPVYARGPVYGTLPIHDAGPVHGTVSSYAPRPWPSDQVLSQNDIDRFQTIDQRLGNLENIVKSLGSRAHIPVALQAAPRGAATDRNQLQVLVAEMHTMNERLSAMQAYIARMGQEH